MKKAPTLVLALAAGMLASCGGASSSSQAAVSNAASTPSSTPASFAVASSSEEAAQESKLLKSYIGTFEGGYYIPAYDMVQPGYDNYVVDLYDDGTYVSNKVIYMNMYGTQGSVVVQTTGSYAVDENEDGDEIVSLSDAASILYTTCGMFSMQYSFNVEGLEDTTFPVALMGSSSNSDTFEFFKAEYGYAYSFLANDAGCLIVELNLPEEIAAHFVTEEPPVEEGSEQSQEGAE